MDRAALLLLIILSINVWLINGQGNGAVAFHRDDKTSYQYSSGVVRIFYNGEWGNICYSSTTWTQSESDVLCHQMGWSGSTSQSSAEGQNYGLDTAPGVIETANCSSSSYIVLLQCTIRPITQQWVDKNDVAVSCYATRIWDSLSYNGHLRLVEGNHVTEGRVEILCNGRWGTVCDDALGREEARTMCHQLGYTDYVRYDHLILPGNTTQAIWLDDVVCQGTESCLATCQSCPTIEKHNCRHGEDFTVSCTYDSSNTKVDQRTDTCENASLTTDAPKKNKMMLIGIALGGGVALILCALVSAIACCCACRRLSSSKGSDYIDGYDEDKKYPPTKESIPMSATSPEVIMVMEESPKAIRKNPPTGDTRYTTHPPPPLSFEYENVRGPTVLYSPATSSNYRSPHHAVSSPRVSNGKEKQCPPDEPLTPPVFKGKPTF